MPSDADINRRARSSHDSAQPRDERGRDVAPHELANELTDDASVETSGRPQREVFTPRENYFEATDAADRATATAREAGGARRAGGVGGPAARAPASSAAGDQPRGDKALTTTERHIGKQMLLLLVAFIVAALIISAIVFRQWMLLWIGVIILVPYMLLISAPFWLASTTKSAQDDSVRARRDGVQS